MMNNDVVSSLNAPDAREPFINKCSCGSLPPDNKMEEKLTLRQKAKNTWQNQKKHAIVWIVALLLIALYAPTMVWLWKRWTLSVWHHSHGIIILVATLYLIWKKLRGVQNIPVNSNAWGFLIFIPALIFHILDTGMQTQLLSAFAFFLALPGLSLLFLGTDRTKKILFPLIFLFLTLPIPLAATEPIHLALRKIITTIVALVIPWLGISVYIDGTVVRTPYESILVGDACSGFSTIYATIAIACIIAYLCHSSRRRIFVLLAAIPVAIISNALRSIILVLLIFWQGREILHTSLHPLSGLFTFALALLVILWIGGLFTGTGDTI